jgi:hypothetical protein
VFDILGHDDSATGQEYDAMDEQLPAFLSYWSKSTSIPKYGCGLPQRPAPVSGVSGAADRRVPVYWCGCHCGGHPGLSGPHEAQDQPYASSTIARKVAAIKSFFNYLAAQAVISDNPTVEIESPKVKKRLPQTLTKRGRAPSRSAGWRRNS